MCKDKTKYEMLFNAANFFSLKHYHVDGLDRGPLKR